MVKRKPKVLTAEARKALRDAARKCEKCGKIATHWWHNPFHPNGDWPRYVCHVHGQNSVHDPFRYEPGIKIAKLLGEYHLTEADDRADRKREKEKYED